MKSFIDVSHTIENGLVTYPGLPVPVICDFLSREASRKVYAEGTEFQIGRIDMVANTGTYVDSPFHRYETGKDLSELPLQSLADLDGIVIRPASAGRAVDSEQLEGEDLKGKAVLINTGWDQYWNSSAYVSGHPFLTRNAAKYLVRAGAVLVGIDSLNIDDTSDLTRPVHTILLRNDIPIVEHLCKLGQLPLRGFKFFAVPVKVRAFGTFPVRAFGVIESR
jgi:arylformamidase